MTVCKNCAKKYPLIIAALTIVLVFFLINISDYIPAGPVSDGISELVMAVIIFGWTFLFMGKEKVTPKPDGFKYAFRLLRGYYIFLGIFAILMIILVIVFIGLSSNLPVKLLNSLLIGATVGIVEEFTFRGLVFGGIIQKLGKSKKDIIIAAVLSGFLFGAMHIIYSAIAGEISSLDTAIAALFKTLQTGIFGVILALIYYTTRNIFAIAALHSLDDFILFVISAFSADQSVKSGSYVSGQTGAMIVVYIIFTLIMVPFLIKSIKDLKENEAIPFDDDFLPRAVKYEKKKK